ncbi:mansc domain containing protein [Anaeramoeba flamelloides]|uniref:Mansc domain containing protein n=1 Tax=Anaeramoeba flamelloides TaxID=1746091 RepID=A0ABQ8XF30_9EUKA|nr:mansc domain containing protein [Anaeramoeba flamelloides]
MSLPSEPSSDEFSIRPISPVINILQSPLNSDIEFASSPLQESYNLLDNTHLNPFIDNNFLNDFSNMTFSENENSSENSSSMIKFKIPEISISSRYSNSTEEQSEEADEDKYGMQKTQFKFHTNFRSLDNKETDERISNNNGIQNYEKMKSSERDYQMGSNQGIQKNSQWIMSQKKNQKPITKVHLFKSSIKREKHSIPAFAPTIFSSSPLSKFFNNVEIKNEHHLKQEILVEPNEEQFEHVKQFENDFNQRFNNQRSVLQTGYHISNNNNNHGVISNTNITPNKLNFLTPTPQLPPKITITRTTTTTPKPTTATTTTTMTTVTTRLKPTNPEKQYEKQKEIQAKTTKAKKTKKAKSTGSKLKNNIVNLNSTTATSPLSIDSTSFIKIKNGNVNDNETNSSSNLKDDQPFSRKRLRRRSSRRIASKYKHLPKSFSPIKSELSQTQIRTETETETETQTQTQTQTHTTLHTRNFNKTKKSNFTKKKQKSNSQYPTQINNNKEIIKIGKSVYKVLIGSLWAILGGSSQTQVSPYSQKFCNHISKLLGVSARNIHSTPLGLKNLLSNSRRTFAEFISEILIGVLSLCYLNKPPNLSIQLKDLLINIAEFQQKFPNKEILLNNLSKNLEFKNNNNNDDVVVDSSNDENNNDNGSNLKNNNNNINKRNDNFNYFNNKNKNENKNKNKNENESENENETELISQLNNLYHKIFVEDVLMFWFEKRFIPNPELRLHSKDRSKFFSQYILIIGNYCFQRCCWLLASELTRESNDTITSQYFRLINSPYQSNPLNCYFNNRMGKMKLITGLIVKFSVNKSAYWDEIVNFFSKKNVFNINNVFDTFPFSIIINSPLIKNNMKNKINDEPLNSTFTRKTLNPSLN